MESALDHPTQLSSLAIRAGTDVTLFDGSMPHVKREDLIFPQAIWQEIDRIIEENQRVDLLRSYGLEPRHRLLLSGSPGTGKTTLAALLASELMLPLLRVDYAMLFGSLLGETTQRLGSILDEASTRACVLLLDEFDALGKSREDPVDTGEVKRVLNYLLLRLEELPTHVIVVAATNRPQSLDRALWRRFDLLLQLPQVTAATLSAWITRAQERSIAPFDLSLTALRQALRGLSFAELEAFFQNIQRDYVLGLPAASMKAIMRKRIQEATKLPRTARSKG
jgi:SpoVK/Ycf46/Vps4 family AAA+-type ATPase